MTYEPSRRRASWSAVVHLALALPSTNSSISCHRAPATTPDGEGGNPTHPRRRHQTPPWTRSGWQLSQHLSSGFICHPMAVRASSQGVPRKYSTQRGQDPTGTRVRWQSTTLWRARSQDGRRHGSSWVGGRAQGGRGRSLVVVMSAGTGETEFYSWRETESDVELRVPLPPGTPAKSVQVELTKTSLVLGLQGREGAVLKGRLKGEIQPDRSHWTMEEEETGGKILYLCLEKLLDQEHRHINEWVGVLHGETQRNVDYPDRDQELDVEEYVKRMGYDRERDADKVDKTMFSNLSEELQAGLQEKLTQDLTAAEGDGETTVIDAEEATPFVDTGVLGMENTVSVGRGAAMSASSSGVGPVRFVDTETHLPSVEDSDGAEDAVEAPREAGGPSTADPSPVDALTSRQREVSAGLRETYDELVRSGLLKEGEDEIPLDMTGMDELAKEYDFKEHFFKDSDFTDEELRRCADAVLSQDGSPGDEDFDVEDPAVRSAFGLE